MRRVLVCGGRDYYDAAHVRRVMDDLHAAEPIGFVIHGACVDATKKLTGADRWAEKWALANEIPYIGIPARWSIFGRSAGPRRNGQMLANHVPDVVVAFPGGNGTADMVRKAESLGIPVVRVEAA